MPGNTTLLGGTSVLETLFAPRRAPRSWQAESSEELIATHRALGEPDNDSRAALKQLAYAGSSLTVEERELLRAHLRRCPICLDYYCWAGRSAAH
jgi:hypothetical protein